MPLSRRACWKRRPNIFGPTSASRRGRRACQASTWRRKQSCRSPSRVLLRCKYTRTSIFYGQGNMRGRSWFLLDTPCKSAILTDNNERSIMKLKFTKMHGAGNDFVVIDAIHQQIDFTPAQWQFLADRRFGVGADQMLVVEA